MAVDSLKREDWVLVVLAAAKGDPLTPVQLQKGLFLLEKRCPEVSGGNYYSFTPYSYGPFDVDVYHDAECWQEKGFVTITYSGNSRFREYQATESGIKYVQSLPLDSSVLVCAEDIVQYVKGQSFQELVASIYREYPEMRVNSIFKE